MNRTTLTNIQSALATIYGLRSAWIEEKSAIVLYQKDVTADFQNACKAAEGYIKGRYPECKKIITLE